MTSQYLDFRCSFFAFILLLVSAGQAVASDRLYPYILSSDTPGDFVKTVVEVKDALINGDFELAGEYTPYEGAHIIVVTNAYLKAQAKNDANLLFALGQRVAITQVGERVQVSYIDPLYFQSAYRITASLEPVRQALRDILGQQESFGAKGLTAEKLQNYHYSYGMEYFDDQLLLAHYRSQKRALKFVENAIAQHAGGTRLVYRIDLPRSQGVVLGVSISESVGSDLNLMASIGSLPLRRTAYLPYEILVVGGKVTALHPRFRLPVHFPDLKAVGTPGFLSIREASSAIVKSLRAAAGK